MEDVTRMAFGNSNDEWDEEDVLAIFLCRLLSRNYKSSHFFYSQRGIRLLAATEIILLCSTMAV